MRHFGLQAAFVLIALGAGTALGGFYLGAAPQVPDVIRPPLDITADADEVRVWGAWEVLAGYVPPGTGAVEIRCFRQKGLCVEAQASLLQHTEGEDLMAEARLYQITAWSDDIVEAAQLTTSADCAQNRLEIRLGEQGARQSWSGIGECEVDPGHAYLVGDPL
ncbi:hypothetical protein B381_01574 [Stutzerimonas stutzeri NF13]|uniref:Uncharacterized protein n=1 Tax=Stutzerimonas stutzeri NF13 TaxID=1212548 RepID=M2VQH9_STUST|nr:hypothetical protein [Stutzerimonas stutzeri]EME01849.1 hypothetical protein B381_01574 [Stutzerimonas stutzeri NF13]